VNRVLRDFGGDSFVETIASHIEGSTDAPTVDLISSQLDADRLDYVLRDGYYAGVPNAQYDLDRIVQMVWRDETGICFDERAQFAIEGYFTARYHLYLQLYYHKTVRAAEVMLRSVIRRARILALERPDLLGTINLPLRELFRTGDAAQAVRVSDPDLWTAFGVWAESRSDPILSDLSRRLLNRELFRAIEIPADSMPKFYEEWLPRAREVAQTRGFDPDYYVRADTARDTPYKIADFDTSTSVRITDAQGTSHQLEARSGLIGALQDEAYQKLRCCVPLEIRDEVRAVFR
jgi:HD superfamily phosphohydrolase